jgi:hypothetical protein
VIDWVVAPLDHVFPAALDEVNVTEPPEQKVVGLLAMIVGVVGPDVIVTLVAADVETQEPLVIVIE